VAVAALLVDVLEGLGPRIPAPEGDLRDVVVD
jgi:hypothetical protein